MELQSILNENKEIIPKVFEGENPSPIFIFRQPSLLDYNIINLLPKDTDDMQIGFKILDLLFVEVKNLQFKNTKGEILPIKKYSDIFKMTRDLRFEACNNEISIEMIKYWSDFAEQAVKYEKKPKSAGKSSKRAKKN